MAGLKQKTVKGLFWSFTDNIISKGINFVIGIILARLLEPREFGIVAMITIFIAISQIFITSGLTTALIRKNECTNLEYSTVFYYNIFISLSFYLILFFTSPFISQFFNEPELISVLRVVGIVLIINAFGAIQQTLLIKQIDFRTQTIISSIASVISGISGIYLAWNGRSYWSLIWMTIIRNFLRTILLWYFSNWRPDFQFSIKVFKKLFNFGSKILVSGLIYTLYLNIYQIVIGKFFSATDLGFFNRADQFKKLASDNISGLIQKVTFPVISSLQNDKEKLKKAYKKLIKINSLINFTIMMLLAAVAGPLILTLIGPKWTQSILYLQLLCFVGMLNPLHSLNLNILLVFGRSDLTLILEVIKILINIPVIFLGIYFGINSMILGMIAVSIIGYYLNSYWSGKFIDYPMNEQIYDILPALILSLGIGVIVYAVGYFIHSGYLIKLFIQLISGVLLFFLFAETTKMDGYLYVKVIILDKLKN